MSGWVSTLEIWKQLRRDHRTIKKTVENKTKLRIRSERKGFKNLSLGEKSKLKRVLANQPLLTNAQIFEQAGIEGVKKEKMYRILHKRGSVKKFKQTPLSKANMLKRETWTKKYKKIDFSKLMDGFYPMQQRKQCDNVGLSTKILFHK